MNTARSKKASEPFPRLLVPTGVFLALSGAGIVPAHATCSQAGTTVTCSGVANPLAPSFSSNLNNINATVNPGASVGVLLGVGGTAMSLTGNNTTLTNNGTIDPSALGSGLGVLSTHAPPVARADRQPVLPPRAGAPRVRARRHCAVDYLRRLSAPLSVARCLFELARGAGLCGVCGAAVGESRCAAGFVSADALSDEPVFVTRQPRRHMLPAALQRCFKTKIEAIPGIA